MAICIQDERSRAAKGPGNAMAAAGEAPRAGALAALVEVWQQRRYLWFFCRRAVNFRYKMALFGWFWLVVRSFFWMLPFSFVVGQLAGGAADGVPYTLFVLVGLTLWNYLSSALSFATLSLRYERDVARQLGLPPMLLVLSNVAVVLIELAVSLGMLYGIGVLYYARTGTFHMPPGAHTLLALPWIGVATLFACGAGFVTSVLDEYAPDIRILVPYVLSFWMLLTPVIYPLSAIAAEHRYLAWLNPMTAVVEGFRGAILGNVNLPLWAGLWSVAAAAGMFLLGARFFTLALAGRR